MSPQTATFCFQVTKMKPAAAAPAAPTPAAAAPTPGNASCNVFAVMWKTHVKLLKMFFRLFYFIIKMNYALGFHCKRQIVFKFLKNFL